MEHVACSVAVLTFGTETVQGQKFWELYDRRAVNTFEAMDIRNVVPGEGETKYIYTYEPVRGYIHVYRMKKCPE